VASQHPAIYRPYTHTKRVARTNLGETTSPRPCNLVVNLLVDGNWPGGSRALSGFFQDGT